MGDHLRRRRDPRAGCPGRDPQRDREPQQRDRARRQRLSGRRARSRERGASAVEFVIVAPLFLAIIFLLVQAGLFFYGRNVAQVAAREGVSYLRLAGDSADQAAYEVAAERVSIAYAERVGMLHGTDADARIFPETGRVRVVVRGTLFLPGGDQTVTQVSTATLEQFRGDPRGITG